jgi:hypothetical protein
LRDNFLQLFQRNFFLTSREVFKDASNDLVKHTHYRPPICLVVASCPRPALRSTNPAIPPIAAMVMPIQKKIGRANSTAKEEVTEPTSMTDTAAQAAGVCP